VQQTLHRESRKFETGVTLSHDGQLVLARPDRTGQTV
jgi:hypothetical protein